MQKKTRTVEPVAVNKPERRNRSTGAVFGPKAGKSRAKRGTAGKSQRIVTGAVTGIMLPPTGKQ